MLTRKSIAIAAAVATIGSAVAACQAEEPKGTTEAGMVRQLVLPPGASTGLVENNNPFSPTRMLTEYMFETLYVYNSYACEEQPWLATDYDWTNPKTLVFTIRDGVKWSDDQPFAAADVAYTFNMLKDNPALDEKALWEQGLKSVQAKGNQVTFTFDNNSGPVFQQIATTRIVPEHIWSKVGDVEKFTNPDPVVTGPYMMKSFNQQQAELKRNPSYWQADKVKVDSLVYRTGSGADALQLAEGDIDWGAAFIPDIEKAVVSKDPEHNKYWFAPGGSISIYMNLTEAPFDDLAFRQAVTYAIDRDRIAEKAQYGYVDTASQTALTLPGQKAWLAPDIDNEGKIPYNEGKAAQILADAEYQKDGDRLLGKDGKPLAIDFKVEAGYSDWIQASQIIEENLEALGMEVDVRTQSPDTVTNDKNNGNFDMAIGVAGGGCNMYENYRNPLASDRTAPIGEPAASNTIRWEDPKTDQLLSELRATPDQDKQKELVYQLQHIMMDEVPFVPLWYGAHWFEYSTRNAVGWPNQDDPYAIPNGETDKSLIVTHLRPAE